MTLGKKPIENIVGKGENAGNQQFLLYPQCFLLDQKTEIIILAIFVVCNFFKFGSVQKNCHLVMSLITLISSDALLLFSLLLLVLEIHSKDPEGTDSEIIVGKEDNAGNKQLTLCHDLFSTPRPVKFRLLNIPVL